MKNGYNYLRLVIAILFMGYHINMYAQYEAEHVISVERFSSWAPDYLTVTNTWANMCYTPASSSLKYLSVITAINGRSTRGMETEEFYALLDANPQYTLTFLTKTNGVNKEYTQQFTKRRGKLLATLGEPIKKPVTISLLSDSDIDLFKYNTFDYQLAGGDQLMDKNLIEVFAERLREKGLKRDTKSPDLYLYITKDVSQNIESMYVPHYTTTTTNQGSGVNVSNVLGLKGVNVVKSSGNEVSVTQDNGSMRTNVVAEAYLQFSILDAKRIHEQTPPIVWQLIYSEHKTSEIRLLAAVKEWIASFMLEYPFRDAVLGQNIYTWGVFCEDFAHNPTICGVLPDSKAAGLGCNVGDVIKYVRYRGIGDTYSVFKPGQNFYANSIIPTTVWMQVGQQKITKGGLTESVFSNYYHYK